MLVLVLVDEGQVRGLPGEKFGEEILSGRVYIGQWRSTQRLLARANMKLFQASVW